MRLRVGVTCFSLLVIITIVVSEGVFMKNVYAGPVNKECAALLRQQGHISALPRLHNL